MCSCWFAVWPAASVTTTVNTEVPVAVGVPLIVPAAWPVVVNVKPDGKAPVAMDQVYGVVPPLAKSCVCGYAVPTVPAGSDSVVIESVSAMLIERAFEAVSGAGPGEESVTCTTNVLVPNEPVGVPVIVPFEFSVNPLGRLPELGTVAHVYGITPPVAASVCEYATVSCPLGSEVVVMLSGGTFTEMVNCLVAVREPESVT